MTEGTRTQPAETNVLRRRWGWRFLGLVIAAPLALVFPEADLWWYAFVGLVPILLLAASAHDAKDAVWRSWLSGTGFFATLHHWLVPTLGPFVVPAALFVGATWIPFGLVAWVLLREVPTRSRAAASLTVLPAVWVLVEAARSWDVLGGSWGFLGSSQWTVGPMLALSALGGVWLLSALLLLANVAVAVSLRSGTPPGVRAGAVVAAGVVIGAGSVWGALRPDLPAGEHITIAGVQPGVVHDREERLRLNEDLTRDIDEAVDIVVWGQSSVGFDPLTDSGVRERLEVLAGDIGVDLLVNVDARRPDGRISKSAVLVRSDVGVDTTYDKQRLVPFGEYIPFRPLFGWLGGITDAASEDRVPGQELTLMRVDGVTFGPLISYESTFPDLRRSVSRLGAEFTLVQAASTTFQGSWAQPQQASFEAVRAVESGRSAVIVAVSGTSAAFDARGRNLVWVPADYVGWWTVDVPLARSSTLYMRVGDWVLWLSLAVVMVAAARSAGKRWLPSRVPLT